MPDFFITPHCSERVFARFDKDNISWTTLSRATPFQSSQQARDRFDSVFQDLLERAEGLSATALHNGSLFQRDDGLFQQGSHTAKKSLSLFMPHWVERLGFGLKPSWSGSTLRIVGKAAERDLLETFELFYVRQDLKWLGRPPGASATHAWVSRLDQAQPFCTYEDALAAKDMHVHQEDNSWIVRTSSRVEGVTPLIANAADPDEPLMALLKASCEAKQERSAIDDAISRATPSSGQEKPARSQQKRSL